MPISHMRPPVFPKPPGEVRTLEPSPAHFQSSSLPAGVRMKWRPAWSGEGAQRPRPLQVRMAMTLKGYLCFCLSKALLCPGLPDFTGAGVVLGLHPRLLEEARAWEPAGSQTQATRGDTLFPGQSLHSPNNQFGFSFGAGVGRGGVL